MAYYNVPVRLALTMSNASPALPDVYYEDTYLQVPKLLYTQQEIEDRLTTILDGVTGYWADNISSLNNVAELLGAFEFKVVSLCEHVYGDRSVVKNVLNDDVEANNILSAAIRNAFPRCTVTLMYSAQYQNTSTVYGNSYVNLMFLNSDNSNIYLNNRYSANPKTITAYVEGTSTYISFPIGFYYRPAGTVLRPYHIGFSCMFVTADNQVCLYSFNGGVNIGLAGTALRRVNSFGNVLSPLLIEWFEDSDTPETYNITYHLVHATGDSENPVSVPVEIAEGQDVFMRFSPTENYDLKYASVPIGTGYGPDNSVIYVWNAERGEMMIRGFTSDITVEVIGVIKAYPVDPSEPTDPSTIDPDSPNYDFSSDIQPPHNPPTWDTTQAGFINVYVPNAAGLNRLANYLWAGSFNPDNLRKLFANPMDVILGCHILPVAVPTASEPVPLAVGNLSTGISMAIASTNWVQYDCGVITIPTYYGAYMAYSPYTKIQIYLPFCGTYEIDADIVVGKDVNVVYNIDVLTGACVVDVSARAEDEEGFTIYYQFTGNCAAELPITSGDYKNILQVLQNAAVAGMGIVAGATTGGVGALGAAVAGAGAMASSITDLVKPNVSHKGSVSGNAGYLGLAAPYLIISTPRLCLPDKQDTYMGYPIFGTSHLQQLTGFTQVESVHLEGFYYTEDELTELEELLKSGVIL